ncbi:hypothetical protein [Qingshengfaniella alkalisoli]|uniref:Uncharacterized protein n=1 Tax=Qingshengfaniella alkalisoli TaxID=2599296 RepID=A0A5B8IWM9_9RHOB|nr:hypothetical protein [Qingshengfaniella alkalisoli]QDY70074.1 hypothetical protein FPZ52_10890 [Qingshengfaniella alkalisoli]
MTKLATTAVMCAALVGATTPAFAGGLAPVAEEPVVAPVMVDQGGLNWTHAAIAAGVIGLAALALADDDDDDDDDNSGTTTN